MAPFTMQLPPPLKQHQQDFFNFCGKASAEIALLSDGSPTANVLVPQQGNLASEIDTRGQRDQSIWGSTPDGIVNAINAKYGNGFTCFTDRDVLSASRRIVEAIYRNGVAVIALVLEGQHWVVVRGFTTDREPVDASGNLTDFTIQSFDVYNPWPPLPDTLTLHGFTHTDSDKCGSGVGPDGDLGADLNNWDYEMWSGQQPLLDGTPPLPPVFSVVPRPSRWRGYYVTISKLPPIPGRVLEPLDEPPVLEDPLDPDYDQYIEPEPPVQDIRQDLIQYGLKDRPDWAPLFNDGFNPDQPILVQRLDAPKRFYRIIPIRDDYSQMLMVVLYDANTSRYMQAVATTKPGSDVIPIPPTIAEVVSKIVGTQPSGLGRTITPDVIRSTHRHWVWRPCRESLSMLHPFARVEVLTPTGPKYVYVRTDGKTYMKLTTEKLGL